MSPRPYGRERAAIEGVYQDSARNIVASMRSTAMLLKEARNLRSREAGSLLEDTALSLERNSLSRGAVVMARIIVENMIDDGRVQRFTDASMAKLESLLVDLNEYHDGMTRDGVAYGGADTAVSAKKVARKYRRLLKKKKGSDRVSGVTRNGKVVTIILSKGPAELTKKEIEIVRKPGLWGQRRGVETRIAVAKGEKVEFGAGGTDLVLATGRWLRSHGIG